MEIFSKNICRVHTRSTVTQLELFLEAVRTAKDAYFGARSDDMETVSVSVSVSVIFSGLEETSESVQDQQTFLTPFPYFLCGSVVARGCHSRKNSKELFFWSAGTHSKKCHPPKFNQSRWVIGLLKVCFRVIYLLKST